MLDLTAPMVEVWFAGAKLGEYTNDIEALKAASIHADSLPLVSESVEYEIRRDTMKYIVHRRITGPDAPALGPVLTISSSALTLTMDRPSTGPTRIDRYEIERYNGSAWTQIASGIAIFSAAGEYPDTGLSASTLYQYRCRAVDTTERASEWSYSSGTTAAGAINQAPVWTSPVAVTVEMGETGSLVPYCTDPETTQVIFSLVSSSPSVANKVTISGPGVLTVAPDCPAGVYTLTVAGSDGDLSVNGTVTLTVPAVTVGTPVSFTATGDGATTINLSWSPSPTGATPDDYELDFSATSASGPWTSIAVGLVTTKAHTGRTAGVTYYYRLRAMVGAAASDYATTSGEIVVVIPPSGTPTTDTIYTGSWRGTEDTVQGWDWTLPSGVAKAAKSGAFTLNNDAYPSGWQGNKIRAINAAWGGYSSSTNATTYAAQRLASALEPQSGNYNFNAITNYLNDPNYDGIFLNVRGFVVSFPNQIQEVTAPAWATVANGYPTYTTNGGVGAITSLLAYNANVKAKHKALITAIGNAGILSSSRLWGQIIHLPGSSRGEEYNTDQGNATSSAAAAIEYIQAWATAAGANADRLMWTNDRGPTTANPEYGDICDAALAAGVGARGGAIESWLWNLYTPGLRDYTLQTWANGYLGVDETSPILTDTRAWHDQNEASGRYTSAANALQQQNYRMAHLRMLQMRRNLLWVRGSYMMNPKMDNWAGVLAGHTAATSPEAWICLMRTWTFSKNDTAAGARREIKNFEQWLYQRDDQGASTPTTNKNHGPLTDSASNKAITTQLTSDYWNIDLARQGTSIGIAVDDDFIAVGASDSVCIKVTFLDADSSTWTLQYTKTNGTTGTKSVNCTDTNIVRTATFFITDFKNPAAGTSADFYLKSSTASVPFMFVRVVKV